MSKKLLLADDSVTIQKVIGITFAANEDYELTVVDNGDAALEKARAERPDLILADVFMPGKNGYELCAAVNQDPQLQGIPVLLLTGTFEPFDEDKAMAAGAGGWIAKPFESQSLIDRVEALLAKGAEEPPATAGEEAWGDFAEPAAVVEEQAQPAAEAPVAAAAEEDWGGISFESEEAAAPAAAVPAEEDIWGEPAAEEDSFGFAEEEMMLAEEPEAPLQVSDEPSPEVVWEEEGEEVLALDDDDILGEEELEILEEEDLEELAEAEPAPAAQPEGGAEEGFLGAEEAFAEEDELADAFAPVAEEELLTPEPEEEPAVEEIVPAEAAAVEEEPFSEEFGISFDDEEPAVEEEAVAEEALEFEEDFSFSDEEPEWDTAAGESSELLEPPVPAEPEVAAPELEAFESPAAEIAPSPLAAEPPAAAALSSTEVEERVQSLSEADLEKIVERLAGSVVEKLAGTILERIAWEVVPDLAESLIRDEIRKIKDAVRS